MTWIGWIVVFPAIGLLLFSAYAKFSNPPQVSEMMTHLGYPTNLTLILGILEITCTIIYLIPQTAVLGAILCAAYLGGATATHVRIGEPFYFPPLVGILLWLGLYFREPRLRDLVPLRRSPRTLP